jgi:hypothetical protein
MTEAKKKSGWPWWLVAFVAAWIVARQSRPQPSNHPVPDLPQLIASELQKGFNENKQRIFDSVHPVGTARNVVIHEVTINAWKHGKATNRAEDVQQFTVRFTVYWEGPVTKDGFTKLNAIYDTEAQRYVSTEILATNGMTNTEAAQAIGSVIGQMLSNALTNSQQ